MYWLFGGEIHYPEGGTGDFLMWLEDLETLKAEADRLIDTDKIDWAEILHVKDNKFAETWARSRSTEWTNRPYTN